MPFDGVSWAQGNWVPAISYQPQAGNTPDAWFTALVTAYASSRRYGRMVASYAWPGINGITEDPLDLIINYSNTRMLSFNWESILIVDGYVETNWTHATAFILFTVGSAEPAYAYHRLHVADSTSSAAGSTVITEIAGGEQPAAVAAIWEVDERNSPQGRYTSACDFSFDSLSGSGDEDFQFTLEASCTNELDTSAASDPIDGDAITYRPIYALILLECRG